MRDFLAIASEQRFSLRLKGTELIPTVEFPAIRESAVKIASERRRAILVHSGPWQCGSKVHSRFAFPGARGNFPANFLAAAARFRSRSDHGTLKGR